MANDARIATLVGSGEGAGLTLGFSLRLLTYNIRKGLGASGRRVFDVAPIARQLACEPCDLLLCQEVFHGAGVEQSAALARTLALHAAYLPNKQRRIGHHGNATFSRWPVEVVENVDLSQNRLERRGALYVRLRVDGAPLHLFNVHLSLSHRQRVAQLRLIERAINQRAGEHEPVILAGDFNDWRRRLEAPIAGRLAMRSAFALEAAPPTWPAPRPLLQLDRVYVRNLDVRRAARLGGEPWRQLSDHLPLVVELEHA